jgi:DNA polymerase I-like protein with 3'-5' exonuclease and polymerase domains
VHDGSSNRTGSNLALAGRGKPNDQLALFAAEPTPFPEKQYRRLTDGGPPFQEFTGSLGGRRTGQQKEYWFPFHSPADWNRVLVVSCHPSFHEVRRMEKHPGEFIGVMTGEAYTLLAAHILQKLGLSWRRCMHANLVPWYVPPKTRVTLGQERYGFQFIERLIQEHKPQLIISFGANVVPHLAQHLDGASVTELQGQLIPLEHYQTRLICATQPGNLLGNAEWIKSWERTMRGALMNWFSQTADTTPDPPSHYIDTPADLRKHLQEIQDDHEEVFSLDTEFVGHDITNYRILDLILSTRSRTLNIRVHEGRHEPVLRNPYDLPDDKGAVYIFPNEEAFKPWPPPGHSFRAYIDDVRWVFQGGQKELVDLLNQYLRRPEIKIVGHALKVDVLQLLLFGVDLRDQMHICTYDLAKVLDEGQPQGLDDLIKVYLGKEDHKAELARYREARGITEGSYGLVPPDIRLPYGCKDGRRTFELVPVMLEDMKQQDEDLKRREPELYAKGWTLERAYFEVKRKQMAALIEMELVGHPFSLKRLSENIEWYDTRLEKLLADTVAYIKTRVSTSEVNPASAAQLRQILFNQPPQGIGLYPMFTTEKPVREWSRAVREMLFKVTGETLFKPGVKLERADQKKVQALLDWIHQQHGSAVFDLNDDEFRKRLASAECPFPLQIPERDYPVVTASTNQETLEMLATADPLCEKLNDCRLIATLANNYCRKDGPWGASRVKEFLESLEQEDGADRDQLELFGAGEVERKKTPDARLVGKRQKAISMAVNRENSILFTTYWGSLETHRLRTSPNVSAIPKGEEEYVSKIIGEAPPHTIRGLEMAPRGWFMVELDYSAAEVQRLAQVSGDPNMTEIMDDPTRDPHASLARAKDPEHLGQFSDAEIKKHHKGARDEAKPFTFGIPYQRGNEAMARSLNREAVRAKQPATHTAENVAHIKDAYRKLYNVAWEYLETQMNRVIPQAVGSMGRTYLTHKGVFGYQVSPAGFRRRYLDPALVRVILNQENRWDSELLRTLKDMRREASNWQIQHGVAIYIMEACANWVEFRRRNPNVPILLIDILHDAQRYLVHWSVLSLAQELLPRIMLEIPSNQRPKLRVEMKITYEWNGAEVKEFVPHPDQPDIEIPGLKYLGLEGWNKVKF